MDMKSSIKLNRIKKQKQRKNQIQDKTNVFSGSMKVYLEIAETLGYKLGKLYQRLFGGRKNNR